MRHHISDTSLYTTPKQTPMSSWGQTTICPSPADSQACHSISEWSGNVGHHADRTRHTAGIVIEKRRFYISWIKCWVVPSMQMLGCFGWLLGSAGQSKMQYAEHKLVVVALVCRQNELVSGSSHFPIPPLPLLIAYHPSSTFLLHKIM